MSLHPELTIELDAIVRNWRALDGISAPDCETAAVVKADAYGLGAVPVARALRAAGARAFFVALPQEGARLRAGIGPGPAIYVLDGWMEPDDALYAAHDLRPVLNTPRQVAGWWARHPGRAAAVQIDTGMNRLGLEEAEIPPLPADGSVRLLLSHLAVAETPESPLNTAQLLEFGRLARQLRPPGAALSLSATGGILLGPEFHFDLTRPGIGLYGGLPFREARPVVTLTLPVLQVRDVRAGETVGYGATWTATRPSRIATLGAGYADGLLRALSNAAAVLWQGHRLPFAGRVSMDLVTVDATGAPGLAEGDRVTMLGPDQPIDRVAEAAGTIGYEVLTGLGSRYARRYRGAAAG